MCPNLPQKGRLGHAWTLARRGVTIRRSTAGGSFGTDCHGTTWALAMVIWPCMRRDCKSPRVTRMCLGVLRNTRHCSFSDGRFTDLASSDWKSSLRGLKEALVASVNGSWRDRYLCGGLTSGNIVMGASGGWAPVMRTSPKWGGSRRLNGRRLCRDKRSEPELSS